MNENKKDVDTKLVQAIAMKLEEMFKWIHNAKEVES
jgi:hypothetical protein